MAIKLKTGDTTWSSLKKVYAKTSSSTWSPIKAVFAKLSSGWQQIWPGNTPAVNNSDPITIRLNSYNGTVATSPQYIDTILYGHDGSYTGTTPITISGRKMRVASDGDGNGTRYTVEGSDIFNLNGNSANDKYLADGWYLFYELTATNIDGDLNAFSPAIKLIRRQPTFTVAPSFTEDYAGLPSFSLSFTIKDGGTNDSGTNWGYSVDRSRSYVVWYSNTSKSPGGTEIQRTYFNQATASNTNLQKLTDNGTSLELYSQYVYPGIELPAGQYIIAQVVLVSSYTDHYSVDYTQYKSSASQPGFGLVTEIDANDNQGTDRNGMIQIGTTVGFTVRITGVASNAYYKTRYRLYDNQLSTNTYYNPLTGASTTSSTGGWIYYDSNGNGAGSISYIDTISDGTVQLTDYFTIDPALFPIVQYGSSRLPKYSLEVEISVLSNGVRAYANTPFNFLTYDVSPATNPSITASPSSGSTPLSVSFSGTLNPYPASGGGISFRTYPYAWRIDYGDGYNSGWNYLSSGYNNTISDSHTYSNAGTYYPTIDTIPTYSTGSTQLEAISLPRSPSYLTASTNLSDGVQLNWENTGANYYEIYWQSIQGGGPVNQSSYADFGQLNEITTNSYKDTTISVGGTRYYRVRARNSSTANGAYTSNWYPNYGSNGVTGTRISVVPDTPTGLSGYGIGNASLQQIYLSWNSANNANTYELYYNGTGTTPLNSYPGDYTGISTNSFTTPYASFSSSTTYYWWVRSVSSTGEKSNWSSRATVTTSATTYTVTWNANGGSGSTTSSFTAGAAVGSPTPTRTDYTFNGWYDTTNPGVNYNYYVAPGGNFYPPSRDITMYASWTYAPTKSAPYIYSISKSGSTFYVYFSGGSGPAYQVWWQGSSSTPSTCGPGDAQGTSNPIAVTNLTPSAGSTYYFFIRSVSSTSTTTCGPSSSASAWSGAFSYTEPSGPTITYSACYEYSRTTDYNYCIGYARSSGGTVYNRRDQYTNGSFTAYVYDCANTTWSSYDPYGCYVAPTCTLYTCLQYDVSDPASPNYVGHCYTLGACDAPLNNDGRGRSCCQY